MSSPETNHNLLTSDQPRESSRQRMLVLLDRDGTINVERNYLSNPEDLELLPGAARAIRTFRLLGLAVAVVTNQSGIGRGILDWNTLEQIHVRLAELLAAEGACVDGIFVCPHAPDENCQCRKPRTQLARKAAEELGAVLESSFVIGDKPSDMKLGRAIGATTILVRTGYGAKTESEIVERPDHVVEDILAAADQIKELLQTTDVR